MSCTGLPLSTPSISCLDFTALWDISGPVPQVTVTNNSTVITAANLNWWFYITAPSGNIIYGSNVPAQSPYPTPDYQGVPWTSKTFNIPTPFGNPPCGQIEFSPNVPYSITIFVEDLAGSPVVLQSLIKTVIIVRPNGNQGWEGGQTGTCGNFGIAVVSLSVNCANQASAIQCADSTNLSYNNIPAPLSTSNTWTMVYPQDPGTVPNKTATNTPNVNFPATVDSMAYTLYFNEYATYDYGNGVTVKVQYKLYNKQGSLGYTFAVNCNVNLCQLICQMKTLRLLAEQSCGQVEYPDLLNKITILNLLFSEIIASIMQPLCGNDVPGMICEWKKIAKISDGDCGCGHGYFGFGNPTGNGGGSGLSPVFISVTDLNSSPPGGCSGVFTESEIYDPTHTTILGTAFTVSDMLFLINSNAAWQAYGTAFDAGSCMVGFFPLNSGITIPTVQIASTGVVSVTPWSQGGNSFGATGIFGTKDNNPINFLINNVVKAILRSDSFVLSATPILLGTGTISVPINCIILDPATESVKIYVAGVLSATYGAAAIVSGNITIGGSATISGGINVVGNIVGDGTLSLVGNAAIGGFLALVGKFDITADLVYPNSANKPMGVGTLASGTCTVANTNVTANSLIWVEYGTGTGLSSGGANILVVASKTAGVGFVVDATTAGSSSTNTSDTAKFQYWIIN